MEFGPAQKVHTHTPNKTKMIPLAVAIQGLEGMPALILTEQAVQHGIQRRRRRRSRRRICTLYHLDSDTITTIVDLLHDDLVSLISIRTAIPTLLKVVCVLHFLATGTYQHTVGQLDGISQPGFSSVLNQVLDALLKHASATISPPQTAQEVNDTKIALHALAGMPNVIGVLDCSHMELVVQHAVELVYRIRKQYHSINVQMVRNARKMITHCCARYPGSTHDSMVLQNSVLPRYMEQHAARRAWLLGDAGYPLKLWLLTPVMNPLNRHEEDYNRAHTLTCVVIEQTFGLLKAWFRCLSRSGGPLI
ncbi:putative nuclease HARBI1 [Ambystoma mexicanum]|uniref:putative nuclease HARBI1 n=1 Tax=Ambystoma mexicanum TaxID=8296 RepID=UPI0037E8CA7F